MVNQNHFQGVVAAGATNGQRKYFLVAGACIVLAAVAAICIYQLQQQSKLDRVAKQAESQQQINQQYSELQRETALSSSRGHYSQAADAWTSFAQKTSDKKYKGKALQNAGLLYATSGDYQKALSLLQKAEPLEGLTYSLSTAIAATAMRAGDKAVAIQYLQDSLKLMPATLHDAASQKRLLNDEINQLKHE